MSCSIQISEIEFFPGILALVHWHIQKQRSDIHTVILDFVSLHCNATQDKGNGWLDLEEDQKSSWEIFQNSETD